MVDNVNPSNEESGVEKALTPMHGPIHCAATDDTFEGNNELDQISIDHFLDTLAEVALAIARRKIEEDL